MKLHHMHRKRRRISILIHVRKPEVFASCYRTAQVWVGLNVFDEPFMALTELIPVIRVLEWRQETSILVGLKSTAAMKGVLTFDTLVALWRFRILRLFKW